MGRVRTIGIKAATVAAVSAAVLATVTVPASAAGVGAAIKVCSKSSQSGRIAIEGRNQHKKRVVKTLDYLGNDCVWLKNWWWIAPGIKYFHINENSSRGEGTKSISEKEYNTWVTLNIN